MDSPRLMPATMLLWFSLLLLACNQSPSPTEPVPKAAIDTVWRPLVHFTPQANWMNDPNGMFFFNGRYHLFYQHNPDASVWGPMHWGHAVSSDLLYWEHRPIALYPDSLGTIFSGSAVVDSNNTSGFGTEGKIPIVAIYTQHNPDGEKAGRNDFQNQSIAYSLDGGDTWQPYSQNPVLPNPGIRDFRDPKVMWHAESKKWIMTLAAGQEIMFFGSPDLKNWTSLSRFGSGYGAHGGVWECPDLFTLNAGGQKKWVLIVNLNPGAPNGGSGTQYFLGRFDGKQFVADDSITRWLDYGPDNYAGITWNNTGNRRIFLGWMSNWQYANVVPTETWRSAMTLARELQLLPGQNGWRLASSFELPDSSKKSLRYTISKPGTVRYDLDKLKLDGAMRLRLQSDRLNELQIRLYNDLGDGILLGYDLESQYYYFNRGRRSGFTTFDSSFVRLARAPRLSGDTDLSVDMVLDRASVEWLADKGRSVLTGIFFPRKPYNRLEIQWGDRSAELQVRMDPIGDIP